MQNFALALNLRATRVINCQFEHAKCTYYEFPMKFAQILFVSRLLETL
jgi:hypothetical protein